MIIELSYEDEGFPVRARKLIVNGFPFFFIVKDKSAVLLQPHLTHEGISDAPKLALIPRLQPLLGVLLLAEGRGMSTSVHQQEDGVRVSIGVGRA